MLHCVGTMGFLEATAARFDIAVVRFAQGLARRAAGDGPAHEERLRRLEETAQTYQNVDPAAFFAEPPEPRMEATRVRSLRGGGEVVDLSWHSGWEPHDAAGREQYLLFEENRIAQARLLCHPRRGAPLRGAGVERGLAAPAAGARRGAAHAALPRAARATGAIRAGLPFAA